MAKISDIYHDFERNPQIAPDELEGKTFEIISARGPYKGVYGLFVVFTIIVDGERRDLLLSYTGGQRHEVLNHFEAGGEPIGPVRLVKLELATGREFWMLVDAD